MCICKLRACGAPSKAYDRRCGVAPRGSGAAVECRSRVMRRLYLLPSLLLLMHELTRPDSFLPCLASHFQFGQGVINKKTLRAVVGERVPRACVKHKGGRRDQGGTLWLIALGSIAKRSALNETHGPEWPLPRKLRLFSYCRPNSPYPNCVSLTPKRRPHNDQVGVAAPPRRAIVPT